MQINCQGLLSEGGLRLRFISCALVCERGSLDAFISRSWDHSNTFGKNFVG